MRGNSLRLTRSRVTSAFPAVGRWQRMILDRGGLLLSGGESFRDRLFDRSFATLLEQESRSRFERLLTGELGQGDGETFLCEDGTLLEMVLVTHDNGCTVLYREIENRPDNIERLAFFYRNFLNTPNGICITNEAGAIREANQAFLDLYGYTLEEMIGRNPRILKSGRQSPDTYRELWQQITDPALEQWSGEIINRKKNGEEVTVHLTVSAVRNATGQHMGFIANTVNLTVRKRIERDLEDCNQKLVELNQLKSDMMAITSHDLKSPLNAIVSRASMLRDLAGEMPVAKQSEQLEKIVAAGLKMASFIDELLDLEKMEAGRFQLSTTRMHLDTLLQTCVETNLPAAVAREILLTIDIRGEQEPLRADMMKLEQVFNNIISNGIKFTPPGGRIAITCDGQRGKEKQISIADNGPGIPEASLPLIFDRYYQVRHDGRIPGRVYGAGLGLSIVKNVIDLHGGSVSAANRSAGGCEFLITLPAQGKIRSVQDIAALIVDPSQEIYSFIEPYLLNKGVSRYIATSLDEVARVCQREQPELVFVAASYLNGRMRTFLEGYNDRALLVAVDDGKSSEVASFPRLLTAPVMDVEVFELIDEILSVDRSRER